MGAVYNMAKMTAFGDTQQNEQTTELNKKTPAFGIDLGTTNSAIAICEGVNTPRIIRLDKGAVTMPSCVLWKGRDRKLIVGKEAYENRYKPGAVYSVKRLMGSGETVTLEYGGRSWTMSPIEVSAEILKGLVAQASTLYKDIKDVTITVPAYFNNKQVEDTLEAGKLAGLNVLNITREPTAASMVYQMPDDVDNEIVLVYDLGGGTFDVTLVRITRQASGEEIEDLYNLGDDDDNSGNNGETSRSLMYTVMDTDGDSHLGGDDIDRAMLDILAKKLEARGVDMNKVQKEDKEKFLLRLEGFKKSGPGVYEMAIDMKIKAPRGKNHIKETIRFDMQDFVEATRVVYNKTRVIVKNILNRAGNVPISSIALVGGSTKSEILRTMLEKDFPNVRLNYALNPDESVALGASIKAKEVKFGDTNTEVFDVLPMGIGVYHDGHITPVIKRGQRVPYSTTEVYQTVADNQESVSVAIYQGNSPLKEESLYLGNVVVKDLPKRAAGEVGVYVTTSIDTNGLLSCLVRTDGGKQNKIDLVNLFGMTSEPKSEAPRDRKVIKWQALADRIEGANKVQLLDAIRKYQAGNMTLTEITAIVASVAPVSTEIERPSAPEEITDHIE